MAINISKSFGKQPLVYQTTFKCKLHYWLLEYNKPLKAGYPIF